MRAFLPLLTALLLLPASVQAQMVWQSMGGFPSDTTHQASMHGVAVDAEGKVWVVPFGTSANIVTAQNDTVATRALHVYNADGTEASFSPINVITVDGTPDTMYANARGLRVDHNGDIIYVNGSAEMYRINHQTGAGMDVVRGLGGSLSAPGVAGNGTIFTANVVPGNPIVEWAADFSQVNAAAVDTSRGFSRSFDVDASGNHIYWAGYSNGAIYKYSRADEFSAFGAADTLFRGLVSESIARDWSTGNVWVSNAPAAGAEPQGRFADVAHHRKWYAIDPATDMIVDSLKWDDSQATGAEKPRGIAFSPDGMKAYAVVFDAPGGTPSVQWFMKTDVSSIEQTDNAIPTSFTLEQNYPNPFNPSTKIAFKLQRSGLATLRVYDMLGREVAQLVNETLPAGSYTYTFDASDLASGAYVYYLSFEGMQQSGLMTLVK